MSTGQRCEWAGPQPIYIAYHDEEWGVPRADDRLLLEKLILEGFQAGLSWITILNKRARFREVFDNFDAEKLARYDQKKIEELLQDAGIIRHRGKIEAAISNAQACLDLQERISLSAFLWNFVDGTPVQNRFDTLKDIPTQTPTSQAMAKALKAEGFRFCGPTTVYAFMQSVGMVNDHVISCPRHEVCAGLGSSFSSPVT
ncbi:MAG: DNA-3-methyladenine glycosylase I [Hyphomicrobiaceae bacterium]|nr:DNA-3-methyladenine glycosylase I [Hyphomicrobiaceae bacterium]